MDCKSKQKHKSIEIFKEKTKNKNSLTYEYLRVRKDFSKQAASTCQGHGGHPEKASILKTAGATDTFLPDTQDPSHYSRHSWLPILQWQPWLFLVHQSTNSFLSSFQHITLMKHLLSICSLSFFKWSNTQKAPCKQSQNRILLDSQDIFPSPLQFSLI